MWYLTMYKTMPIVNRCEQIRIEIGIEIGAVCNCKSQSFDFLPFKLINPSHFQSHNRSTDKKLEPVYEEPATKKSIKYIVLPEANFDPITILHILHYKSISPTPQ